MFLIFFLIVSEKIGFDTSCKLSPKERVLMYDLDLEYSCSFIYLFSYLHLQIFRSQAGIVSEKYSFDFFPYKNLWDES